MQRLVTRLPERCADCPSLVPTATSSSLEKSHGSISIPTCKVTSNKIVGLRCLVLAKKVALSSKKDKRNSIFSHIP